MRTSLLAHLCCPGCRCDLELQPGRRQGSEIITGTLRCRCGEAYEIRDGVPRFVRALTGQQAHTARNFGTSWKIWRGIDEERYRWQLLNWLPPLEPDDFRDRRVLDVGCGKGRHLRLTAKFGAREVIGVDLSEAVDVAYENTRTLENVHVIQADLNRLPLKGGYDLAYSIGVLHHTEDPQQSFQALQRQVRPGGTIACWVYGRENNGWIVSLINPIRTHVTRHLPARAVRAAATALAACIFTVIYTIYLPARALHLRLFYQEYMLYLRALGFGETCHIVYDHLIAPTAFYLRRGQVDRWFDDAGVSERTVTWVNRNSWAGVGLRKAA